MSVFSYESYKIRISPDSDKTQGLRPGDIVRRQYIDRNGSVYTLMGVKESGIDVIEGKDSPYFIGALLDGDAPRNGELLDFVRVTSLSDPDRSGALYLTASDSEAPYMDVVDGMATEQSLCYPFMDGGMADVPDKSKYTCFGSEYISVCYKPLENEALRLFRVSRNDTVLPADGRFGLKQTIEEAVGHPERLLVSFRSRASKPLHGVSIQFGYTNGEKTDGTDTLDIGTAWKYELWVITIEYPRQYSRSLCLELTGHLSESGDWCEISDLNIVRLSSVASFSGATKSRVGKVSGIIDPVYGILEGYGAYFQRLYATKDVNISGTLTAGDKNGFASTFYVGKIHKNVVINSLECCFSGGTEIDGTTPAGIGKAVRLPVKSEIRIQTGEWRERHAGGLYCFSVWMKSDEAMQVSVYQDEYFLQTIDLAVTGEWQRNKVVFFIRPSVSKEMNICLQAGISGLCVTAPQLESGDSSSPYQATDEVLSYTDDYGAWFCKGGVGGTIQHPLLRLNDDGSISSCDGSFVINRDGTGHFAGGRFKWTKDTIALQDVTIRWEDLEEVIPDNLKPYYVNLEGGNAFHYTEPEGGICDPASITIVGTEYNFEGTDRRWEYLSSDGQWKSTDCHECSFCLTPVFEGWEGRDLLSLRYTAVYGEKQYSGTHSVFKHYAAGSSYSVYVESDNGTVFRNGVISTTLKAHVYENGIEITDEILEDNYRWTRISRDTAGDALWNSLEHMGRTLEITGDDVRSKAVFDCEITISTT